MNELAEDERDLITRCLRAMGCILHAEPVRRDTVIRGLSRLADQWTRVIR